MHLRFRKTAKATAARLIARYTYVILLQLLDANFRYRIDKILRTGYFVLETGILQVSLFALYLKVSLNKRRSCWIFRIFNYYTGRRYSKLRKILIKNWNVNFIERYFVVSTYLPEPSINNILIAKITIKGK